MTAAAPDLPAVLPWADALAAVTVVADGDGYVIGNPGTGQYVAVPPVGADVVRWLQAGHDPAWCADQAERAIGEPVDVDDFLMVLHDEGILITVDESPAGVSLRWHRLGRVLFSRIGWAAQVTLAAAGVVAAVADPALRPRGTHLVVGGSPLATVLVLGAAAVVCTVLHELGHVLAAAAAGVSARITISRRLYFLTAQADLTRLWGLPRRRRLPPLLAGLSVDAAITGALLVAQTMNPPDPVRDVLRAVVVLQVAAIVFQAAVFMRTDLYAVLATVSGSRNLWALKSAVLRRALHRATPTDDRLLLAATDRERAWARTYLTLYLPGTAAAGWYLAAVTVPGIAHLIHVVATGLTPLDLHAARTWQALAAAALILTPTLLTLLAAVTAPVRRFASGRRAGAHGDRVVDS